MNRFFLFWLAIVISLTLFPLGTIFALEPGESIILNPTTGNYDITYIDTIKNGVKVLVHARYFPATKIDPSISSNFQLVDQVTIRFTYTVGSRPQSRQLLTAFRLNLTGKVAGSQDLPDLQTITQAQVYSVLEANKAALATPAGWRSDISTYEDGASISWNSINSTMGIQARGQLKGFGFDSQALPGLGEAQFEGKRDAINGYAGEGPDPDSDIARQIQALDDNDYVPRNAAVPAIAVPNPFDAAVLLDRIRSHVTTWPGKQLLDPAYAAQLDRYLAAAADAYRLNNSEAGKEQIETIRKMLEKEHKYLDHDDEDQDDTTEHKAATRLTIDRLAARVLDFDLRYVLKRMEHGRDEDERKRER